MTTSSGSPEPAKPEPQPQHQRPPLTKPVSEPHLVTSPASQPLRGKGFQKDVQDISDSIQKLKVSISSDASPKHKYKTFTKGKKGSKNMDDKRNPIFPPSLESGGIPCPSPEYLTRSEGYAQPIQSPQHLLVVIDLNGTILFRPSRAAPQRFVARPHASRFLQYCIDTFKVVIWSSARPENVAVLVDAILPPSLKQRCVAIWGRDKFNLTPADYSTRVQCYKRLNTVWSDPSIARSHPEFQTGSEWDQTNTVLVDDSIEKGRSEPFNIIPIPEYTGNELEKTDILPQVHDYLNQLSLHSNVSAYMRSMPFVAQAAAQGIPAGYADSRLVRS